MRTFVIAALSLAFVASPALADAPVTGTAAAPVTVTAGHMLVAANGSRLGPISRVSGDSAQIILDGRVVRIPVSSIAMVDGKLTTSLTKPQVLALR